MMIGEYALLAVIGLMFAVPLCVWLVADAKTRHDAAQAYAVGYRAGQRAEFEAQARAFVAKQSFAIQAPLKVAQAKAEAEAYIAQRGALG